MFVNDINKKNFRSVLLLDELITHNRQFKTAAEDGDKILKPYFEEMRDKGYVSISGMYYIPTAKGREAYDIFNKRFQEYLRLFDVFSFVDLTAGEFAFARFFDFDTDEEWLDYASDERFEDLRIAVAIAKKADPAEIVFMSFINENRINTEAEGWQTDLSTDAIWQEIEQICDAALKPGQLGTPDVIEDIIRQGTALMLDLLKEEQERKKEEEEEIRRENTSDIQEETIVEEYETVEYYQPYYRDPWYISPLWLVPLFLW